MQFTIEDPLVKCVQLEHELIRKFGLKEAHVVMAPSNEAFVHRQVAAKAAQVFDQKIVDGIHVGVAWGKMVSAVVNSIRPIKEPRQDVEFVSTIAGLTAKSSINPLSLIHRLGELYDGEVFYISAPAVVDSIDLKKAILEERSVEDTLKRWDDISLTVVGIGYMGEESTLYQTGCISKKELADFKAKGAVGEVLLYHYDLEGNIIESDYHDRLIGIGLEGLRNVETVIGAATGTQKVEAMVGAIKARMINVLATDEVTAEAILAYA